MRRTLPDQIRARPTAAFFLVAVRTANDAGLLDDALVHPPSWRGRPLAAALELHVRGLPAAEARQYADGRRARSF